MHPWERDETRVFFEGGAGGAIDTLKGLPPPKDLAAFWQKQRARLAAVPVRAERRPLKSPNESVALWAVEIACAGKRPVAGYLSIPLDSSRKWPARLQTHGYAFFKHTPPDEIKGGEILLDINAHGQKLEAFGGTEEELKAHGESIKSNGKQYAFDPVENADPEAALTRAQASVPWCCDLGGATLGRNRGDWGVSWVPALGYYDPINMARLIPPTCRFEIPRAGLGDYICPPSGLAVFYNNLTCPREIRWMQGSTHSCLPYHARSWMRISRKCAHRR